MTRLALGAWLERLERRSPESAIELGLDRVGRVFRRLGLNFGARPIISVAGTNGKGSTVAFLDHAFRAAGWCPFVYTSPHLLDFRERIQIGGQPAADGAIVDGLERVERARGDDYLTWFEHVTLAALCVAEGAECDLLILEVGLGGRLDAVNVLDADVAVLTSIGLDHADWLGRTRLQVGREKAGIARSGRPLIVGERRLPTGLLDELAQTGARLLLAGRDFRWRTLTYGFAVHTPQEHYRVPPLSLAGRWQHANAACAILAIEALQSRLPVARSALESGLVSTRLRGRLQRLGQSPEILVDVAHNAAAARELAAALGPAQGPSSAVFAALEGKNVRAIGRALDRCFDHWLVVPLVGARARPAAELAADLEQIPVQGAVETVKSVAEALRRALDRGGPQGRTVIFGSFHTVAEAWPELQRLTREHHG